MKDKEQYYAKMHIKYFGIKATATELGVTPQHLRMVLLGERTSARLMRKVKKSKNLMVIKTPRFMGIMTAAKELGVTPQHLRKVLLGERISARLIELVKARYPRLILSADE